VTADSTTARLRSQVLGDAGGLRYHARALRHHRAWAPFHAAVAGWLRGWEAAAVGGDLVLVGPSAGYALPAGWLGNFRRVLALEPDPLARFLLRRRPDAGALSFSPIDALTGADGLAALAAAAPGSALLFCNVLGQVPAPPGQGWRGLLERALADRTWASFHDVFSTERPPDDPSPRGFDRPPPLPDLLGAVWTGGVLEGFTHDTYRMGGDAPHAYACWALAPRQHHLVEWHAHQAPGDEGRTPVVAPADRGG